jgi:hypothetical protein
MQSRDAELARIRRELDAQTAQWKRIVRDLAALPEQARVLIPKGALDEIADAFEIRVPRALFPAIGTRA